MKCRLCKSESMGLFLKKAGSRYFKCSNCGVVCLENMPDPSEISAVYNDEYFIKKGKLGIGADFIGEEKLYLSRFRDRIKRIKKRISPGRILDIGASIGQFLHVAQQADWDIYGLEISEAAANMAKKRYGIHIQVGTLEEADFRRNFFDVVTLWHVFEHFLDPVQSLMKIHSLLRKDGLLVIELPNIGSKTAVKSGIKWPYLLPAEHLFYYSPSTISRLLENSNFQIETIEYTSGGTGIGDFMDRKGLSVLKRFLVGMSPLLNIFRGMSAKIFHKSELMIIFSRKKDR